MLSFNQIEPIKRKENYTNFIKTISSPHKTKSENVIGYKEGKNKQTHRPKWFGNIPVSSNLT